jgi:exosome complex RNA-binding protein Rrp4
MRRIMQEGDLIVAEVHSVNNDKTYNLHTRNPKYGRLEPGTLIEASHRQVKRQRHHMVTIGRVGLILGNNGNLYLSNFRRNEANNLKDAVIVNEKYTPEEIKDITVVGNLLRVLSFEGLEISEVLVKELL